LSRTAWRVANERPPSCAVLLHALASAAVKLMKTKFFKRVGWFYAPVSIIGFIVSLLAVGFCVTVFLAVDRHSHSVSDTFYGVFPFFVCTFLLVDWIAGRTS
jgi:hypothetical protein